MSSRLKLTFRSPLTPVWLAGLLLFSCFFLPFMRGCNNEDIAPYQLYSFAAAHIEREGLAAESLSAVARVQWINAPYVFGLLVTTATLLLAITGCRAVTFRSIWWSYAIPTNLQVLALWVSIGYEAETTEDFRLLQFAMRHPWVAGPSLLLPMVFVLTRYNCRTWTAAALCVQALLSLLCTAWFGYFWYQEVLQATLPVQVGVKLALGASIALLLATLLQWRYAASIVHIDVPTRHVAAQKAPR